MTSIDPRIIARMRKAATSITDDYSSLSERMDWATGLAEDVLGEIPAPTLWDHAPDGRPECVGMWATVKTDDEGDVLAIITGTHGDWADLITPDCTSRDRHMKHIIPRYDLQRAWTATGEPRDVDY